MHCPKCNADLTNTKLEKGFACGDDSTTEVRACPWCKQTLAVGRDEIKALSRGKLLPSMVGKHVLVKLVCSD